MHSYRAGLSALLNFLIYPQNQQVWVKIEKVKIEAQYKVRVTFVFTILTARTQVSSRIFRSTLHTLEYCFGESVYVFARSCHILYTSHPCSLRTVLLSSHWLPRWTMLWIILILIPPMLACKYGPYIVIGITFIFLPFVFKLNFWLSTASSM